MNWSDLSAKDARRRYACSKEMILLSASDPASLYPEFATIAGLLDGTSNVLVWNALLAIGNLARVDAAHKVDALLPKIVAMACRSDLVTSSNAIKALGVIGAARLELAEEITAALLSVELVDYTNKGHPSPECGNVAIGHVLNALDRLRPGVRAAQAVADFISRQLKNPRPAVARHARLMIGA